jgi:hypothetical protein
MLLLTRLLPRLQSPLSTAAVVLQMLIGHLLRRLSRPLPVAIHSALPPTIALWVSVLAQK